MLDLEGTQYDVLIKEIDFDTSERTGDRDGFSGTGQR